MHGAAVLAEQPHEALLARIRKIPERLDARRLELALRRGADAAEGPHRKRREELAFRSGEDGRQAPRLVHVGGDLRNGLGRADADRARDAELLDAALDALGYQDRMLAVDLVGGDVQKRLVDAHLLDERRLLMEDSHDGVGHLAIAIETALRPDRVGTEALRLRRGHG